MELTSETLLRLQSAGGLLVFVFVAWVLSEGKTRFQAFSVIWTILMQLAIAALFFYTPPLREMLGSLTQFVSALQQATEEGTRFVFGHLGGGDAPFEVTNEGAMFNFAFRALPLVIFFSALSAVLWHLGILKLFVRAFALLLEKVFRVGGAVALSSAANSLMGQSEAPLLIKPFLAKISRSELFVVITGGFATVAGSVMALYATILAKVDPSVLGHIIVASIISIPAAILMARVMIPPETGEIPTPADAADQFKYAGAMDAFMQGVTDGLALYLNIIAAIIAFMAAVALINIGLGALSPEFFGAPLSVERVFGWVFMPFMHAMGVPAAEAYQAGALMGIKTAVNEVVAYSQLAALSDDALSPRTRLIMIYAMCGFANFSSLGIVIGGLSVIAKERRHDVIELGPKALVAGTLATLMTGSVVGVLWTG